MLKEQIHFSNNDVLIRSLVLYKDKEVVGSSALKKDEILKIISFSDQLNSFASLILQIGNQIGLDTLEFNQLEENHKQIKSVIGVK